MITTAYVRTMAAYNSWQNGSIYRAADGLSDQQRRADRGAFFGSIHGTLNHLLWADRIWLSRIAGLEGPSAPDIASSVGEIDDWSRLKEARARLDRSIADWAATLAAEDLDGDLTWYSGAAGREITKPLGLLLTHLFNHQTHHRGQVHALLTGFGAKPDDTDLPFMPDGPEQLR
ncbi:MAG: DinB family protein [Hyphomicrobiales bacterium]